MSTFYSLTESQAEKSALVVAYHEDEKLIGARGLLLKLNSTGEAFLFSNSHRIMELPLTYCMTVRDYEMATANGAIIRPHRTKSGATGLLICKS